MSNEYFLARYERETDPPPVKRPWIVRARAKSWRTGEWCRWYTHGTYTTEERAKAAASGFNGPNHEARFCHRTLLTDVKDYEARESDTRGEANSPSPKDHP
jgi:hypothetical protein